MPKNKKAKAKLPAKVIKYLDKAGLKHSLIEHKTVYTAFDAAKTMKRKFSEVAKTLLVKADRDYYLVLVSAEQNLDLEKLKTAISRERKSKVKVLKIPNEKIIKETLKVKKDESLSAFAGLYRKPLFIDRALLKVKKAVFASDSFNYSVELSVKDFIRLENAALASFGIKKKVKLVSVKKAKVKLNRSGSKSRKS
ncbi:MAG: YbaK/EbsC family protein [Patescibacteria group bacterium]|nr:YbaK/EbsC family protein [Patescibacteria group bacterium]